MIQHRPYRLLAITMAFVVLLSSTGFGLVENSCMMRGKSVELSALKKASTGCKACKPAAVARDRTAPSPQFNKKACCDESQSHQKIEVVSSASFSLKIIKPAADPAAIPFPNIFFADYGWVDSVSATPSYFLSFSPIFYGRSMLSFVQSFLI